MTSPRSPKVRLTLAHVCALVAIAELACLMDTRAGTAGDGGTEQALASPEVDLHGRVTTGVEDLAGVGGQEPGRQAGISIRPGVVMLHLAGTTRYSASTYLASEDVCDRHAV